jgi:hypothetical protein
MLSNNLIFNNSILLKNIYDAKIWFYLLKKFLKKKKILKFRHKKFKMVYKRDKLFTKGK